MGVLGDWVRVGLLLWRMVNKSNRNSPLHAKHFRKVNDIGTASFSKAKLLRESKVLNLGLLVH